uniref:Alpha-galactosidase n=1 Tax=Timema tahoe TaxID=61484 RepID=A0A7R9ILP7_9NEOP|nr:unnamed protein product [Timema tahoe]
MFYNNEVLYSITYDDIGKPSVTYRQILVKSLVTWPVVTVKPVVACLKEKEEVDYEAISKTCNLWRNYGDIQDSWSSVANIMDWFALNQDRIAPYAGPGHWNDPDMLIIGDYGLSYEQSKTQMAVWAILAAPLLLSTDIAAVKKPYKEILQNTDILAVNQDPLGIQGKRVYMSRTRPMESSRGLGNHGYGKLPAMRLLAVSVAVFDWQLMTATQHNSMDQNYLSQTGWPILLSKCYSYCSQDDSNTTQVWTRAISPKQGDQFSYAVALVSRRTDGIPHPFSVSLEEIGLNNTAGYHFKRCCRGKYLLQLSSFYDVKRNESVVVLDKSYNIPVRLNDSWASRDGLRVSWTVDFFEREWMTWEKNHQVEVLQLPPLKALDELVELTLFLEKMSCYLPTHLTLAEPEDHFH